MNYSEILKDKRILVTGGSRGLGRAIVEALLARGASVTAVARNEAELAETALLGASARAGDVTDPTLMENLLAEIRPSVLILNAGATPHMAPIDEQTWDTFSTVWNTDAKAGFYGVQAALQAPLAPGSRVLIASSGAARVGAPLSGSYTGAKWMLWAMGHYANDISRERGLGIQFQLLVPMQIIGETKFAQHVTGAYARRHGSSTEAHITARYGEVAFSARQYGEQVAMLLSDPTYTTGVAYGFHSGSGINAIEDEFRRGRSVSARAARPIANR